MLSLSPRPPPCSCASVYIQQPHTDTPFFRHSSWFYWKAWANKTVFRWDLNWDNRSVSFLARRYSRHSHSAGQAFRRIRSSLFQSIIICDATVMIFYSFLEAAGVGGGGGEMRGTAPTLPCFLTAGGSFTLRCQKRNDPTCFLSSSERTRRSIRYLCQTKYGDDSESSLRTDPETPAVGNTSRWLS